MTPALRKMHWAGARLLVCLGGLAVASALAGEADGSVSSHHVRLPDLAGRSTVNYTMPHVQLVRADGKRVWLPDELDDGRAVVVDFIYTTCTSVCPLSSQTFASLQEKLGPERDRVHFVSFSIDPEQDTPDRLAQYSRHFDAGPQWQFYTGSVEASLQVQKAFRAYLGDKMSHAPLTLLRTAPGRPWVRFDGFATVNQLMDELRNPIAVR